MDNIDLTGDKVGFTRGCKVFRVIGFPRDIGLPWDISFPAIYASWTLQLLHGYRYCEGGVSRNIVVSGNNEDIGRNNFLIA